MSAAADTFPRMASAPQRARPAVPSLALACAVGALIGAGGTALAQPPSAAAARVEVGVYQDDPVAGVPALRRAAGSRATRVISTYVTGGRVVDPAVVALARRTRARLLVSWMPDGGRDGARQPRHRLAAVRRGAQDAGLRRLVRQLRTLRPAPILRPMPEPNTLWYAWSGTVNRNSPAAYVAAWKRVRRVVRSAGGRRIRLLWSPYSRSIPATPGNAIAAYFPGAGQVDLVGTSGYNFGAAGGLAWTQPDALFEDAYLQISALAAKPFWIAETGSTARGGSKRDWLARLAGLGTSIPSLAGVVWYDVRDGNGDFRIGSGGASRSAFRAFARRAVTP
jgi:hypothetical protein